MEYRAIALRILQSPALEDKLAAPPPGCTDHAPGDALRIEAPARSERLRPRGGDDVRVPSILGMADPAQRGRLLHALLNHEFQAVELFAWALLAFPDTPPEFRRGLFEILQDEQKHSRMYLARVQAHGLEFGDEPVSGYFWSKLAGVTSPQQFICAMSLTFENANLDHTTEYAQAAREAGDEHTAAVFDKVHDDEIEHVRFGWYWLGRFKNEDQSMEDAYRESVSWPLRPALARGRRFHRRGRERAGMDADFIDMLERSTVDREAKRAGRRVDESRE